MWEDIFKLRPGMINTRRGTAVASHSLPATPAINRASFEDMLAEEANCTLSHQPRHVTFVDMIGGLTSTPCNLQEEVAKPTKPTYQNHPEKIVLHVAMCELRNMCEPKISKLKGGYSWSARLVF